jgi:hypothetical protein
MVVSGLCVFVSKKSQLSGCLVVAQGDEKRAVDARNAKTVRGHNDWNLLCSLSHFSAELSAKAFREYLTTISVEKGTLPRGKRTHTHVLLQKINICLAALSSKCPDVLLHF